MAASEGGLRNFPTKRTPNPLACDQNPKHRTEMAALSRSTQTNSDFPTCVRSKPQASNRDVRTVVALFKFRRRTRTCLIQTGASSAPEFASGDHGTEISVRYLGFLKSTVPRIACDPGGSQRASRAKCNA